MDCHHHGDCPHDHEGESCLLGVESDISGNATEAPSVEEAQIIADAAVAIAEIEAETEQAQIEASLEHHAIEAETEQAQIEASLEHHEIEAERQDDLEEVVEDLGEAVEELEETIEETADVEEPLAEGDGDDAIDSDVVAVAPPARIEAPGAPKKAVRRSHFTARHSRAR